MPSSIRKSFALALAGFGLTAAVALADPKSKTDPPAKGDPKPPVVVPKHEPVLPPPPHISLPKIEPKLPEVKLPVRPIDPVKPLPTIPTKPEVKLPAHEFHLPIVHEKPKTAGLTEMPKGPGLKLPAGTKFDHAELAKIKPPVDLTKTKPETILAAKPPADFKVKPIKLDSIHVPTDAPVVEKLSASSVKNLTVNNTFIVNKTYYTGGDYHLKFGTKTAFGYCYPGKWHTHWHHCIWDPCFGCYYFYCPSTCCYYYWCETDYCYYPCYWFVEYGAVYYPWWICGGFQAFGYVARPTFGIFIGW